LLFVCRCHLLLRDLHSFPTRRSSDLPSTISRALSVTRVNQTSGLARNSRFIRGTCCCSGGIQGSSRGPSSSPQQNTTLSISTNTDRKSTRLNSSHVKISYAVFCLKKK